MSEIILRSRFLLSTIFSRNRDIDEEVLRDLLSLRTIRGIYVGAGPEEPSPLKKSEITTMLLQAVPPSTEDMPLNELLQLSIGLVAVLSIIGIGRKEVFILRELLQRLTPSLIEARKVGAAEMGIHPDAGLWSLGNASNAGFLRIEKRTKSLLRLVGAMYASLDATDRHVVANPSSREGISLTVPGVTNLHPDGSIHLKIDILRSCIAICEILPDFGGVLKHSLRTLHLARGAILVPSGQPSGSPAVSQEEQAKLMDGIKRSITAATRLAQSEILADYWDDFLIRGIEAIEPPAALRTVTHSESGLDLMQQFEETRKKDPFIYKPSSKPTAAAADKPLVADEMAYFSVYLQNPLEIEVEIDEIRLAVEGCDFRPSRHSIVLGRFCCQKFTLAGTAKESGILKITGCRAKIRYCKERDFDLFPQDTHSNLDLGSKKRDSAARNDFLGRQIAAAIDPTQRAATVSVPGRQRETLEFTVLEAQPVVSLESTTLSQPALMLLEGERKRFEIVLKNESKTVDADLVRFNFDDSATSQLQTALKNQDLAPSELYELQLQLVERTPIKHLCSGEKGAHVIPAGGNATFAIEVLGLPGLLQSMIQIEYANVGMDVADVKEKYYTRQLSLAVAVTVNAAIEAPRCNVHRFSRDFVWQNPRRASRSSTKAHGTLDTIAPEIGSPSASRTANETGGDRFTSLLARLGLDSHGGDHCLLSADVRNAWPFPLSVSLQVGVGEDPESSGNSTWRPTYAIDETLQPGQISRTLLIIPRLYVPEPHAPIPLINSQRQFVVSATKSSVQAEQANREAFWYREELLKRVKGTWREIGSGREGKVDLRRGIRLNARMIDALKIEEVEISISILSGTESDSPSPSPRQEDHSRFVLHTDSFATVSIKIHNNSAKRVHALLRIRPCIRDQPHHIALDLSKRLAWTGMLHRALHPALEAGEVREMRLGIMALSVGEYELGASVEELKAPTQLVQNTQIAVRSNERRTWHAREPCLLDAVDTV